MSPTTSEIGTFEHADGHGECLFIGVDRKWMTHGQNDAIDSEQPCSAHSIGLS